MFSEALTKLYARAVWLQVNSCSDKRLLAVLCPCWKGLSAVSLGFLYIYYYIYTTDCAETDVLGEGKENQSPKETLPTLSLPP